MGICKDCLKGRFHALVSCPVLVAAGAVLSEPQIDIAGLPNVSAAVLFLVTDKRYCNIENDLLTPGLRDFYLEIQKRESPSLFRCIKNRGTGTPFESILPCLFRNVNHLFYFFQIFFSSSFSAFVQRIPVNLR